MEYGISIGDFELLRLNSNMEIVDNVNSPKHYQGKGIEAIDVIEGFELNFALGNAVKYILRADRKANKKQDLEKALWYLKHELDKFNG